MRCLVFGASSQIGHFLLPRLEAMQAQVLAVSRVARSTPALANVTWRQAQLPDFAPASFDSIIAFAPLHALAQWLSQCETAPARKLVATGSMSAESKRDSAVASDRALSRMLREGEAALAAQCARLGIDFLILRPTLIYGAGMDKSLTPIAHRALRLRVFPLPLAKGLRQPVHADDIALAVLAALRAGKLGGITLEIGGGERIEYREMFRRVHASLPLRTLPLPIPASALRVLARAVPAARGPVSRLAQDLLADNRELQRMLGIAPRGFAPDAATWGLRE